MSDPAATQAFYGRWARLYDVVATLPGIDSWRAQAVEALALSPGDTVVEMGCGTGANLPHLRERVGPEGTVVGIDLTPGMLRRARERIAGNGWDNVHLARADASRPPIAGPVDAVLSTFLVGLLPDPGAAVDAWLTCLAAEGSIVLLNATRSDRALAAPLNAAFDVFVRLAAPGGGDDVPPSAAERLEARIDEAAAALARGTTTSGRRRLAGGFVTLARGRRPVV